MKKNLREILSMNKTFLRTKIAYILECATWFDELIKLKNGIWFLPSKDVLFCFVLKVAIWAQRESYKKLWVEIYLPDLREQYFPVFSLI